MKVLYDISLDSFTMEPNIEEDPCDLTAFDDIQQFWINDGCLANSCLVEKPQGQGHNGPCTCFNRIPRALRIQCKKEFFEYCQPIPTKGES